jgi:hypothetical protein
MKAQGNGVKDNDLFQDNKSAIISEKNGKALSSKRTKHINIQYFFIADCVKKDKVSVVWCPTGDMIGDFATKQLQGGLYSASIIYIYSSQQQFYIRHVNEKRYHHVSKPSNNEVYT